MSDIERLTALLVQQAETSAQREDRLAGMLERLMSRQPPAAALSGEGDETAAASRPAARLPAAATPAPHLQGSANLSEFAAWREKLEAYFMLTGISHRPVREQRAAVLGLIDDEWQRVLRYGLCIDEDKPLADEGDDVTTAAPPTADGPAHGARFYAPGPASGPARRGPRAPAAESLERDPPTTGDGQSLPSWENDSEPPAATIAAHREAILASFPRVFDGEEKLRPMVGAPMTIDLKPGYRPVAITAARAVPFAWREEVKAQLDDLQARGIIAPVDYPTEWCHGMVLVPKPAGGVRVCVDFTPLNKYVERPAYPTRTAQSVVADIPAGQRWFSTLDAKMGYFQVEIAAHCQDLTCFMTPWGRMRFLRAPMGLTVSGDEYLRRGDEALGGVTGTAKIVDDILAYDVTYRQHLSQCGVRTQSRPVCSSRYRRTFSTSQGARS